jgi:hypothetical protein
MQKHQNKNIKPMLYKPGKSGHCPVILKYTCEILCEHDIFYHLVDNQIKKLVYELIEIVKKEWNLDSSKYGSIYLALAP